MSPTHVIGGYREFAPGAEAADFCESVWIHQTPDGAAPAGAAHRILPEMGVSLAFQGFRDADGRPRNWAPILAGPKLRTQVFDLVPGRELAAIKIKPEWVGPLLGFDPLARSVVTASRAQQMKLAFAYSDRVHVFVNGRLVFAGDSTFQSRDPSFLGIASLGPEAVYIELRPGPNEIVLAVAEKFGGWGFAARLEPVD